MWCLYLQPTPPLKLSGTSASIATLLWQVSSKEGVLEKVQDEMHQVSLKPDHSGWSACSISALSSITEKVL